MTTSIGIFYGSTNGNTERVAQLLKTKLEHLFRPLPHQETIPVSAPNIELLDVTEYYVDEMADFDYLILGVPTWDTGQMQKDWEEVFTELDEVDLTGKKAALFGLGDQIGYPQTFLDALFFLAEKISERGATTVGSWSTDGYEFDSSWAAQDGQFVGLAIDEDNQPELTEMRVTIWATQLKIEFGL